MGACLFVRRVVRAICFFHGRDANIVENGGRNYEVPVAVFLLQKRLGVAQHLLGVSYSLLIGAEVPRHRVEELALQTDRLVPYVRVENRIPHTLLPVRAPVQTTHRVVAVYRPVALPAGCLQLVGPDFHFLPTGRAGVRFRRRLSEQFRSRTERVIHLFVTSRFRRNSIVLRGYFTGRSCQPARRLVPRNAAEHIMYRRLIQHLGHLLLSVVESLLHLARCSEATPSGHP